MYRILIVVIALVVAAGLYLVFRPDDADEPSANPPPATVATTGEATTTVTTTAPPPPPPGPPPPAQVRIVVRGGLPVGGPRRVTVARNRRVVLTVTSDVSDEVHLHGYDLMQDVGPGMPARIAFRATRPGTVEAELEDAGVQIARITAQ
jgi:hypothetical protein